MKYILFCLFFLGTAMFVQGSKLGYRYSYLIPQQGVGKFFIPASGLGVNYQLGKADRTFVLGCSVDFFFLKSNNEVKKLNDNVSEIEEMFLDPWYYDKVQFISSTNLCHNFYGHLKFLKKPFSPYFRQGIFISLDFQKYYGIDEMVFSSSNIMFYTESTYVESQSFGGGTTSEIGVSYDYKSVSFSSGIAKTYGLHGKYGTFTQLQYNFTFYFIL